MTDKEWYDLCERNWHKAAAALKIEGYIMYDQPGAIPPAIFIKGNDRVYLARNLGSADWYRSKLYLAEVGGD